MRNIIRNDPLLSDDLLAELRHSTQTLQARLNEPTKCKFYHFKTLKSNLLPVTNVAFNKEGNRYRHQTHSGKKLTRAQLTNTHRCSPNKSELSQFSELNAHNTQIILNMDVCFSCVTGSYDRTARIWDVDSGQELYVLRGHENAVFSVNYNFPLW